MFQPPLTCWRSRHRSPVARTKAADTDCWGAARGGILASLDRGCNILANKLGKGWEKARRTSREIYWYCSQDTCLKVGSAVILNLLAEGTPTQEGLVALACGLHLPRPWCETMTILWTGLSLEQYMGNHGWYFATIIGLYFPLFPKPLCDFCGGPELEDQVLHRCRHCLEGCPKRMHGRCGQNTCRDCSRNGRTFRPPNAHAGDSVDRRTYSEEEDSDLAPPELEGEAEPGRTTVRDGHAENRHPTRRRTKGGQGKTQNMDFH